MERRLHTRHRARTTVYVVMSGRKSRICKAKNLSANGVFVETENLGLRKGQQVQLAFAINLGLITKIHRRTAIVAHVTRGGTGLMMEQFAGRGLGARARAARSLQIRHQELGGIVVRQNFDVRAGTAAGR
jgi:hypothetical protein